MVVTLGKLPSGRAFKAQCEARIAEALRAKRFDVEELRGALSQKLNCAVLIEKDQRGILPGGTVLMRVDKKHELKVTTMPYRVAGKPGNAGETAYAVWEVSIDDSALLKPRAGIGLALDACVIAIRRQLFER